MNTQNLQKQLAVQINETVQAHGIEACFAAANAVYDGLYRSEPVRICDHLNGLFDTQEDYYDAFNQIESDIKIKASEAYFFRKTGVDINSCNDDDRFDEWLEDNEFQAPEIKEDSEICFLCNYKGEDDRGDVALYSDVKSLQVFVSKYNYK